MDYFLFKSINDFAGTYPFVGMVAVILAKYTIFVLPFFVFSLRKMWKRALLTLFISASGAYSINAVIGFLYFRSRPFVDHPAIQLIHKSASEKSFPSDHTALAFALAMALFFFDKRIGYIALILATGIGIGRIAVGVHYPSDVFAGMIVGAVSAYIVNLFFIGNKKCIETKV